MALNADTFSGETRSIDFYIRNHLSALEHAAAARSEQRPISFIYHYLIDASSLGRVGGGLKCLCGNELCLIRGGRSLGGLGVGRGRAGGRGFVVLRHRIYLLGMTPDLR